MKRVIKSADSIDVTPEGLSIQDDGFLFQFIYDWYKTWEEFPKMLLTVLAMVLHTSAFTDMTVSSIFSYWMIQYSAGYRFLILFQIILMVTETKICIWIYQIRCIKHIYKITVNTAAPE